MDAAVAALIGAAVGVTGTVGVAWIQQRAQTRRELVKMAVDLAVEDYKRLIEHSGPGRQMPPIALYVAYHADLMRAIADDTFGRDTIDVLDAKSEELMRHVFERDRGRREARADAKV